MTEKNEDLHGNAPDRAPVALVLIDVINDLEFEGGEALLAPAIAAADRMAALKRRCHEAGIPVIYANDNFGRWRSDFREVVDHCLHDGVRGQPLAERLTPGDRDYFVLKPKHSAFFATTLDTLLEYLGARRLILGGFAADMCVKITALDAYMRDFDIHVPEDCVAAGSAAHTAETLAYLTRIGAADTTPSDRLDLAALAAPPDAQ